MYVKFWRLLKGHTVLREEREMRNGKIPVPCEHLEVYARVRDGVSDNIVSRCVSECLRGDL